jgi:hypothetical protein
MWTWTDNLEEKRFYEFWSELLFLSICERGKKNGVVESKAV